MKHKREFQNFSHCSINYFDREINDVANVTNDWLKCWKLGEKTMVGETF